MRRLHSKESITWITPFVAGMLDDTIWDSFTLILPENEAQIESVLMWCSLANLCMIDVVTVVHFLQSDCVAGLQWVAHLVESHTWWEECTWCHVSHNKFVCCCLIGHHKIDFFLCMVREGQISRRENGVCSATVWIYGEKSKKKL